MEIAIPVQKLFNIWSINPSWEIQYQLPDGKRLPVEFIQQMHISRFWVYSPDWKEEHALCIFGSETVILVKH